MAGSSSLSLVFSGAAVVALVLVVEGAAAVAVVVVAVAVVVVVALAHVRLLSTTVVVTIRPHHCQLVRIRLQVVAVTRLVNRPQTQISIGIRQRVFLHFGFLVGRFPSCCRSSSTTSQPSTFPYVHAPCTARNATLVPCSADPSELHN